MLAILDKIDSIMYYPILILILAFAGIYFTIRTRFVQGKHFIDSVRIVGEKPADKKGISSFQALMVSTASRVGTGNIVGVSTAICLGGPGAVFWMWLLAIIGSASAFIESTLAQIYKQKDQKTGETFGGPAYYIEYALQSKFFAVLFVVFLIATYAVGFNLLCSYNLQTSFAAYSLYDEKHTPVLIGGILAALVGICIMGGGKRIVRVTEFIVPIMGIIYVAASLIVVCVNIKYIPEMFRVIFADAFDFKAIGSGVAGSCMVYGIKRGLYSNEAGVGSAPNASASATVSHPVKQGLVQMLSVYIDTILLCTATAFMCLASGIVPSEEISGAPYVQASLATVFGKAGPIFITIAMVFFAFTTLIGNLYYVNNGLAYLNGRKMPGKLFMNAFHVACILVVFVGAITPMNAAWDLADITMGGMTLINLPACFLLGGIALKALRDFERQQKEGKNPVFKAEDIGLEKMHTEFWN